MRMAIAPRTYGDSLLVERPKPPEKSASNMLLYRNSALVLYLVYLFYVSLVGWCLENENILLKAQEFYDAGMFYASDGHKDLALANLRTACRLNNQSAQYWNDLGVTEMRSGQLRRALKRFRRSLDIDPTFSYAEANIRDLKAYLIENNLAHYLRVGSKVRKHCILVPKKLTKKEYLQLQATERQALFTAPVVVENFASKYKMQRLFDLKKLLSLFGHNTVDYYPHNMREEQVRPVFASLRKALEEFQTPLEAYTDIDVSEAGSYIQWNLDKEKYEDMKMYASNLTVPVEIDDANFMTCFPSEAVQSEFYLKTHWKMLLIGEKDAGMFLHQDILLTAAYQIQLVGKKKWHMCSHDESPYLYKAGDVDMFEADYDSYPLAQNASCYEIEVKAGDLLYYPAKYWHQTLNLDTPTIAISSSVISEDGFVALIKELGEECAGAKRIFLPSEPLCQSFAKCSEMWKGTFQKEAHLREGDYDEL